MPPHCIYTCDRYHAGNWFLMPSQAQQVTQGDRQDAMRYIIIYAKKNNTLFSQASFQAHSIAQKYTLFDPAIPVFGTSKLSP